MNDDEFLAELRSQLLVAAETPCGDTAPVDTAPRRRWRRARVLAAAAAVLAVIAVGVERQQGTAAAAVEVIRVDGAIIVRIVDLEARADEVTEAARDAGIHLEVTSVPVGPSNVGRFVAADLSSLPEPVTSTGSDGRSFDGVRIPDGWDGQVAVQLGRHAEPGEDWAVLSDATAASEPLACTAVIGATVAEVQAAVADAGLNARWFTYEPTGGAVERGPQDIDAVDGWVVVAADAVSPDEVVIEATPDGSWPGPAGTEPTTGRGC